jgi:hypothetical protein
LDLARSLPGGELVSLKLQDEGYDRRLLKHGPNASYRWANFLLRVSRGLRRRIGVGLGPFERFLWNFAVVDQTLRPDASAQIQCIVKRVASKPFS